MSKSLGNVINPLDLVEKYGVDAVRYILLRHVSPFEDSDLTLDAIHEHYTAHLTNGLGNLVARVMKLAETYLPVDTDKKNAALYPDEYQDALRNFEFNKVMEYIFQSISDIDKTITETEPFKVIKTDPKKGTELILDAVLRLYVIGHQLKPFMPETAEKIISAVESHKKPDNLFPRL